MPRLYDYRYIVGIEGPDGVLYVNNFKHYKDQNGIYHILKVDLALTPLMIPDLARAKAVKRAVNGRIWRIVQEDLETDGTDTDA